MHTDTPVIPVVLTTGANGYSAAQVIDRAITLDDLIDDLEAIRDTLGGSTPVVVQAHGRGAVWEPVTRAEEGEEAVEDW